MRRHRQKSLGLIIFQEQFSSLVYLISVFVIYLMLFYWASLSLLLETLRYLFPLMIGGGVLIFFNLFRAWRMYKK
jgi:hypothetical protein